ncbi:putative MFS quinate transporter [Aspergillus aculeatinus CBS 121060]|uniref:MFS quinate transporter n=1 Tax=Aspergillus aculeatinus CBS 121060 TaxID=1448322 RepID=A0ACD1HNJ4_9EURO|nr:putative MFS quinate transporter [Aspergillus aculeatinus CBS 121060]RAH75398.1 putative MFS quinate transporter [Aspergillus aculeatinus CBS 121060]
MAGSKKPINIFQLGTNDDPKEIFNRHLWFSVISFGLMGTARGIDEGLITGTFNSADFQRTINFQSYSTVEQANIRGNVSSMVQIGSVGGALIAFLVCDRVGRVWATRQLCVLWMLGIAIFMAADGSLGVIYAGRFVAGLGVGQTVVVGPLYLAEIAPASIRGLCTCIFTGFVYIGVLLAYFTNYGCEVNLGDNTHNRWLVPTSLHIMFAGIILILSFFQYESPRYLVKQSKDEQGLHTLAQLRKLSPDHPYVVREFGAIQTAYQIEVQETQGIGYKKIVKEAFSSSNILYRLHIVSLAQILAQWSGAGSITIYAPDLFKLLGITGTNESLLITAVLGVLKFIAAIICALFLVDYIGRKRSLLLGISLQAFAMIYIAAFLTTVPELGVVDGFKLPNSMRSASRGAVAMIYISGFGWALGWNSIQYLLTAELFPLRIRALATSITMTLHFVNQYGNSRAVPDMLLPVSAGGISPKGTFWLFAAVTILGGLWVWFSVPETAGRTLEGMDRLFELPWYRIGLYGNADAVQRDLTASDQAEGENNVNGPKDSQPSAREIERV